MRSSWPAPTTSTPTCSGRSPTPTARSATPLRLEIELERVHRFVRLRHVRFHDLGTLVAALDDVVRTRRHDGEPVDFVDGVVFSAEESYLTLGHLGRRGAARSATTPARRSTTARSSAGRSTHLTARDYLWRWDTDWFWCSRAFGAQNPRVRRLWPRRYLRSDVYSRLIRFENQHRWAARWDERRGRPARERVVQDVEIPIERTADFLRVVPARGARSSRSGCARWRCATPTVSRGGLAPLPDGAGRHLRQRRLLVDRPDRARRRATATSTAPSSGGCASSAATSRSTPTRTTTRTSSGPCTAATTYAQTKKTYDPDGRLPGLYDKAVRRR